MVAAIVGVGTTMLGATPGDAGQRQATDVVRKRVFVRDNFFDARSLRILSGTKVTWIWRGENSHNVTFTKVPRGASKRGADTQRRGRFTRSFGKPGLYKYVCTVHYGQRGSVDVEVEKGP